MAASAVLLQSLGNGTIYIQTSVGSAAFPANRHVVYVVQRSTPIGQETNPAYAVPVYTTSAMSVQYTQPLSTGTSGASPGGIPGYVQGEQEVDFYDATTGQRQPMEPMGAADLVGTDGKTGGPGAPVGLTATVPHVSTFLAASGGDDAPGLSTAIAAAITQVDGEVVLGAGVFQLNELVSQTCGAIGLKIRGAGAGQTILMVNNSAGGISLTGSNRAAQFVFEGLTIMTSLHQAAFALSCTVPQGGSQHQRSLVMKDVQICGTTSSTGDFIDPLITTGHWRPLLDDVIVSGPWNGTDPVSGRPDLQNDMSDASAQYYQQTGITLDGSYKPDVKRTYVWGCNLGISHSSTQSGMEGGEFDVTVVNCKRGLYLHTPDVRGEWRVRGHINCRDVNVDCNGRMLGWIDSVLSYNQYTLIMGGGAGFSTLTPTASTITADVPNAPGSGQTIPVADCSQFQTGVGLCSIGNEQITFTGTSVGSGPGNLTGCTRGVNGTTVALHQSGSVCSMAVNATQTTIPVADTAQFQTAPYQVSGSVLIGAECVTFTGTSTTSGPGNLTGCTRGANDPNGSATSAVSHVTGASVGAYLNATTTSIPIDPSDFYSINASGGEILIGTEQITYTGATFAGTGLGGKSIITLTGCTRGANSTTAVAHASSAPITVRLARLNGGINNSVTTITVGSTAGFADQGMIRINSEYIWYESKNATQFLNCVRGAISSTAASQSNAVLVFSVSTDILIRGGSDAANVVNCKHHFAGNPDRIGTLVTGGYYGNACSNVTVGPDNYFDTTMIATAIDAGTLDTNVLNNKYNTTSTFGIGQTITQLMDAGTRTKFLPLYSATVTSTQTITLLPGTYVFEAVGPGGGGGGGGADALTGGVGTQVGGGGGGAGEYVSSIQVLTAPTTITCTISATVGTGGNGGVASSGSTGNSGSGGTSGNPTTISGLPSGTLSAVSGTGGNGGTGKSTSSSNGGGYGLGGAAADVRPGMGGAGTSNNGSSRGGPHIGRSGSGGQGGAVSTASLGGNAGSAGSSNGTAAPGLNSGNTGTSAGGTASAAAANSGAGGGGGGGGAAGGAGGNGGNGGSGCIWITQIA